MMLGSILIAICILPSCLGQSTCYNQRGIKGYCKSAKHCASIRSERDIAYHTICEWRESEAIICCMEDISPKPQLSPTIIPHNHHKKCGHGVIPSNLKIVNGEESKFSAWPWMAAIYQKIANEYVFACGGTLINRRYILTAAHCFKLISRSNRSYPENFEVRLGDHNIEDRSLGFRYQVEEIVIHESFRPPIQYNDITLLRLKEPVAYNKQVSPICLPIVDDTYAKNVYVGKFAIATGWGLLRYGGRKSSTLQQVDVPIKSNSYCDKSYSVLRTSKSYPNGLKRSTILCAGYKKGGKDACQDDSGGPLMVYEDGIWVIIGIISSGHKCARPNFPGIYTRVSEYTDWVNNNIY